MFTMGAVNICQTCTLDMVTSLVSQKVFPPNIIFVATIYQSKQNNPPKIIL